MNNEKLNEFGEPDDIKLARYSSWVEVEGTLRMIGERRADMEHGYASVISEKEFMVLLSSRLTKARNMIEEFAPNYHQETLEGWGQAAAEMSHP